MTQHHTIENDDGKTTQHVFFGRVRKFHVKEHVIDPEDPDVKILPEKFKVVARLGGWTYGRVTRCVEGLGRCSGAPLMSLRFQRVRDPKTGLG